ncbi:DNA topoisomerase III [Nematocida sp. LUAm3]|nr:DNA topoisomerase III [Nematocida sp. LUAm3]KAI5175328.1 DNA topoisomerase III [Nematocida sp. LUAm2]KAI5177715.1 DNA topoisomerase III [Nematocida sp. LUAm1]
MRILNVAEKPSVAKALAEILSNGTYKMVNSSNKYCKNLYFDMNVGGEQREMVFTSVLGHLFSLEFEKRTGWTEVDPKSLFEEKVIWRIEEKMQGVSQNLIKLSKECSELIIWTDCDREGENIGKQIANLLSNIRVIHRARFSGLGKYEIYRALENLCTINNLEAAAVSARIELDLRIGASLTRLQTLSLQQSIEVKNVLSYGSCQIPTLGFVAEREEIIKEFVPEANWTIDVTGRKDEKSPEGTFKWKREKIFDEEYVNIKCRMIKDKNMTVESVERKTVYKYRPVPLRTVEMQKYFAKRGNMITSHELMRIAESLYTSGYISYPRTETDSFPEGFNYKEPLNKLKRDGVLGEYASSLVPEAPSKGKLSDQAHTPIYPMKDGNGLYGNDRAVYEYVARRFLAVYSKNAVGEETVILCQVESEYFERKTLEVRERNYLDIYIYDKWGSNAADLKMKKGDIIMWELEKKEGTTEPPTFLTEADLISKMDANGIGTDATIHDHIQRIKEREYISADKNYLQCTWLGMGLIKGYQTIGLSVSKPHLRKEFEDALKKVCAGEIHSNDLLQQELALYKDIYDVIKGNIVQFKEEVLKSKNTPRLPLLSKNSTTSTTSHTSNMPYSKTAPNNQFSARPTKSLATSNMPPSKPSTNSFTKPAPKTLPRSSPVISCAAPSFTPSSSIFTKKMSHSAPPEDNIYQSHGESASSSISNRKRSSESFDDNSFLQDLPEGAIICHCNIQAEEKIVKKEGPTKGRSFLTCFSKQCNFFQWKDEKPAKKRPNIYNNTSTKNENIFQNSSSNTSFPPKTSSSTKKPFIPEEHNVQCSCGRVATLLRSNTEKNKNREFFKCSKLHNKCDFFLWKDEQK